MTFGDDIIFEWPPRNTLSIKTRFQIEFNIDFDLRIDIRNSRSYVIEGLRIVTRSYNQNTAVKMCVPLTFAHVKCVEIKGRRFATYECAMMKWSRKKCLKYIKMGNLQ